MAAAPRNRGPAWAALPRLCVVAAVSAVALSGCDSPPPVQANPRQVTVVGSGQALGQPDTATADVGIEVVAPGVAAAMNAGNQRAQAVLDALRARGIEAADIRTTAVGVAPQYGENSQVTGYRATNSVQVTIRDLDAAPGALAAVVNAGGDGARIDAVRFSIADDSALVSQARARAFEDAKARAGQYAQLSGLSLGEVISISETAEGDTPRPLPAPREAMAADVPLEPGQQTVGLTVTAVWELN